MFSFPSQGLIKRLTIHKFCFLIIPSVQNTIIIDNKTYICLIGIMWFSKWGLRRRTLHLWRKRWPSWCRLHTRAHSLWLYKWKAKSSLIFSELGWRVRVITVRRMYSYRTTSMLRWGRSWRMIHKKWHLGNDMPRGGVIGGGAEVIGGGGTQLHIKWEVPVAWGGCGAEWFIGGEGGRGSTYCCCGDIIW